MKVLAIGAHPDDVEPQIGGTLAKINSSGGETTVAIVTETATGAKTSGHRNQEGEAAAKILGASFVSLGLSQLDEISFRSLVNLVDELIAHESPSTIFCVNPSDSHQDHQRVAKAVRASARNNQTSLIYLNQALPGGINCPNLNYFSDISDFQQIKMDSLACYASQINKYGDSWIDAIEARDKFWGFNIGAAFAEAAFIEKYLY